MNPFKTKSSNPTKLLYAVYDSKVGAYGEMYTARSEGEALRIFADTVNHPETHWNKHPEDYCLFEMGEYDYTEGKINPHNTPKSIIKASSVIKPVAQTQYPINPRIEPINQESAVQ